MSAAKIGEYGTTEDDLAMLVGPCVDSKAKDAVAGILLPGGLFSFFAS